MIERTVFDTDHLAFRDSYTRFAETEIAPHHARWEQQGYVDRAVWEKAGANGFLCMTMPEALGGSGADRLYAVAQMEVNAAGGYSGIGFGLHNEIVAPYLLRYGTEDQKKRFLPVMALGTHIGAVAMSEPAAGSDLQGTLDTATASMAKYWCSDLQCKVMEECLQLYGGYGYMWEYPITRAFADARVQRIYGGTNEIMKEVITRSMGLKGE